MTLDCSLEFPPFRLDVTNACLWCGSQRLTLRPKTFAVLHYLVEHAMQLVTKEELQRAIWGKTVVSTSVLRSSVQEIRALLDDDSATPRYIETVVRRGYRFIGEVVSREKESQNAKIKTQKSKVENASLVPSTQPLAPVLVGRDAEFTQLHTLFAKAQQGERQLVFVTGEPGIGKTALVDAFLEGSRLWALGSGASLPQLNPKSQIPNPRCWVGRGNCIEQYGTGEAYMPVLEALGRLCRAEEGQHVRAFLKQHAPLWLLQMPALLTRKDEKLLLQRTQGATRERMLREMADAIILLTADSPLIFVLEDLHWSDAATLELLSVLARRQEPARLLIVGTYRSVSALDHAHPLRTLVQELHRHHQFAEVPLPPLSAEAVQQYLVEYEVARESDEVSLRRLAQAVHQRTDGNPLFMVNLVHALMAHGGQPEETNIVDIASANGPGGLAIPTNTRQMILAQLERLSPELQQMLDTASVAGVEFSAAAVAAGLGTTVAQAEVLCEEVVRNRQFFQGSGIWEWPDGTVAARYRFAHALYQEVLYERLTPGRRQELHQRIGARTATAYGERAREIAAELAMHFEYGREYAQAVRYLRYAAETASRRYAYAETIHYARKGLAWLSNLPVSSETIKYELALQMLLAPALLVAQGYTTMEIRTAYQRARVLSEQQNDAPRLFWALMGLHEFHTMRAEIDTTRELASAVQQLAQTTTDASMRISAHQLLGYNAYCRGELAEAWRHYQQEITLPDTQKFFLGQSAFWFFRAIVLSMRGYAEQAERGMQQALAMTEELAHPFVLVHGLMHAAAFYVARDLAAAWQYAERSFQTATDYGFASLRAHAMIVRGRVLAARGQAKEGIVQIREGLEIHHTIGAVIIRPSCLLFLAEAYGFNGQREEALQTLDEAFAVVRETELHLHLPRLWLCKGEFLLQQFKPSLRQVSNKSLTSQDRSKNPSPQLLPPDLQAEAEACFLNAIEIARQQQAKSFELRAVISLVRLRQRQNQAYAPRTAHHESHEKLAEAHSRLAELYRWFTEGFATKDLQEAKILLAELVH